MDLPLVKQPATSAARVTPRTNLAKRTGRLCHPERSEGPAFAPCLSVCHSRGQSAVVIALAFARAFPPIIPQRTRHFPTESQGQWPAPSQPGVKPQESFPLTRSSKSRVAIPSENNGLTGFFIKKNPFGQRRIGYTFSCIRSRPLRTGRLAHGRCGEFPVDGALDNFSNFLGRANPAVPIPVRRAEMGTVGDGISESSTASHRIPIGCVVEDSPCSLSRRSLKLFFLSNSSVPLGSLGADRRRVSSLACEAGCGCALHASCRLCLWRSSLSE